MSEHPDPANVPWTAADRMEVAMPRCALTREQYQNRMRWLREEHGEQWMVDLMEAHDAYQTEE